MKQCFLILVFLSSLSIYADNSELKARLGILSNTLKKGDAISTEVAFKSLLSSEQNVKDLKTKNREIFDLLDRAIKDNAPNMNIRIALLTLGTKSIASDLLLHAKRDDTHSLLDSAYATFARQGKNKEELRNSRLTIAQLLDFAITPAKDSVWNGMEISGNILFSTIDEVSNKPFPCDSGESYVLKRASTTFKRMLELEKLNWK